MIDILNQFYLRLNMMSCNGNYTLFAICLALSKCIIHVYQIFLSIDCNKFATSVYSFDSRIYSSDESSTMNHKYSLLLSAASTIILYSCALTLIRPSFFAFKRPRGEESRRSSFCNTIMLTFQLGPLFSIWRHFLDLL